MTNPKSKTIPPRSTNSKKKKKPTSQKGPTQQPSKTQTKTQSKQQHQSAPQKRTPHLAIAPPIENPSEYPELLQTARSLTAEEREAELLECARYGEVDSVRAILQAAQNPASDATGDSTAEGGDTGNSALDELVNTRDGTLSTPLHKAAANGHASTVSLLLSKGARHMQNDSGNTPLHWAAGAGKGEVCAILLDHFDALSQTTRTSGSNGVSSGGAEGEKKLDVLLKNSFGRSALTEGFASGDTKTVEVLLNHDSAEEERLIGGLNKEEVDAAEDADADEREGAAAGGKGIIHEFDFLRGFDNATTPDQENKSVLIRELPITHPDNPFGQCPEEDTTGLSIWAASLIMARWLSSPPMARRLEGKRILELGAGCAVPSLAACTYSNPASVIISDLNAETVENIEFNIGLLKESKRSNVRGATVDWADEETYPEEKMDYVICSDCIYQKDVVPLLKRVVLGTLKQPENTNSDETNGDGPSFLYVAPEGGRDGLPEFLSVMKQGFECVREEVAPDSYGANPLKSGDEEDAFLHFGELGSCRYVLYEFRRCG